MPIKLVCFESFLFTLSDSFTVLLSVRTPARCPCRAFLLTMGNKQLPGNKKKTVKNSKLKQQEDEKALVLSL